MRQRLQFFKVTAGWQRQGALGKAGTLVTDVRRSGGVIVKSGV